MKHAATHGNTVVKAKYLCFETANLFLQVDLTTSPPTYSLNHVASVLLCLATSAHE